MILKISVSLVFSITLSDTKMLLIQSITNITAKLYTREITAADSCRRSSVSSRSIIPTTTKFCTMTGSLYRQFDLLRRLFDTEKVRVVNKNYTVSFHFLVF